MIAAVTLDPSGTVTTHPTTPTDRAAWAVSIVGPVDVYTGYDRRLVLLIPDGLDRRWPHIPAHFNWRATALYGRSPIYGPVVAFNDDGTPLDDGLTTALLSDHRALMRYTVTTHPELPADADEAEVDGYVASYSEQLDRWAR